MAGAAFMDLDVDLVELAPYVPPAASTGALREVAFRPNAWLASEVETLRTLFAADTSVENISLAIGRPHAGVRDKIVQLGLRRNSQRPWSELEDAELVNRYGQVPASVLAQELGRSCGAVYVRAQLFGLSEANPPPFTPWEDAQIRAAYGVGVPVMQVSALIGRTWMAVNSRAHKIGARHAAHPPGWSHEEMARALALAEEGGRYLLIIEQLVKEGFPRRTKSGFGPMIRKLGYGRGWGKAWTDDEDVLLTQAYESGGNLRTLGASLGRSPGSLRWRAEELGVRGTHPSPNGFRQGPNWKPEEDAFLRANYGALKPAEIGRQLGRPKGGVFNRAWQLGLEAGYWRHFTEQEDLAIRIAARQGIHASKVGRALGRVSRCVTDRAVKHLGVALPKGKGGRRVGPEYTLASLLALEGHSLPSEGKTAPFIPPRIVRRLDGRRARRRFGLQLVTARKIKRLQHAAVN